MQRNTSNTYFARWPDFANTVLRNRCAFLIGSLLVSLHSCCYLWQRVCILENAKLIYLSLGLAYLDDRAWTQNGKRFLFARRETIHLFISYNWFYNNIWRFTVMMIITNCLKRLTITCKYHCYISRIEIIFTLTIFLFFNQ